MDGVHCILAKHPGAQEWRWGIRQLLSDQRSASRIPSEMVCGGGWLELLYALQRRKPQRLGVTRDVALSFALEARRTGIEGRNELAQVVEKRLVRAVPHTCAIGGAALCSASHTA